MTTTTTHVRTTRPDVSTETTTPIPTAWIVSLARLRTHVHAHGYPERDDFAADRWRPGRWAAAQQCRWDGLEQRQQAALLDIPGFRRPGFLTDRDVLNQPDDMLRMSLAARRAGVLHDEEVVYRGYPVGEWLGHVRRRGEFVVTIDVLATAKRAGLLTLPRDRGHAARWNDLTRANPRTRSWPQATGSA